MPNTPPRYNSPGYQRYRAAEDQRGPNNTLARQPKPKSKPSGDAANREYWRTHTSPNTLARQPKPTYSAAAKRRLQQDQRHQGK